MSDVFNSYSRLDKEFTRKLREMLIQEAQQVWFDWEAIPPSQSWWEEIRKGMARANSLVMILLPNSMASPIYHMEIEYARDVKKRFIPVLYAEYDREESLIGITKRHANKDREVT